MTGIADCLVIGGGPAGLTAAIYLARFHLAVRVFDAGLSRALSIPLTRNHAGYPGGIAGSDLVGRMRQQAALYGASLLQGTIETLEKHAEGHFIALAHGAAWEARTVLLATGVVNRRPRGLDDQTHARALATGQLRYCPICDGYEVTDKQVAVLGTGERGLREALFLRSFTASLSLIAPDDVHDLTSSQRAELEEAGVEILGACSTMDFTGPKAVLTFADGSRAFDAVYPALGSDIRSELARGVGARTSEEGCLTVDAHQRTNVPGLYAAGDVVLGLDQISHAMGEGGVAATTIRNDLARLSPLRRAAARGPGN
ncbi:NAD(P)/FAD-dependent oxidoreductase [Sphingomonas immobilis]|uniref:Thioredoxin reductase n=1 Tax=Sphingomonas immobilis TaxID=3063997 RepID=A0ABT8ZWJ5_9SPHN|nr:NAD(P)/FAD-dependent oxidoreductase [Sphingomonas sp. CA1-15]MDO7841950.1 NAD(P)/FAD-dependent oxidoreductase [Sphingomonas sp. CA1-15]